MQALRVELTEALAYWTVVDDDWCPVPVADVYLRHLRLGRDRAEGTTKAYAGDLALFLGWCAQTGRDLPGGARALSLFVAMLRTTPVQRRGSGQGRARSAGRINHVLAAVRELYKHAVADGAVDASVLGLLSRHQGTCPGPHRTGRHDTWPLCDYADVLNTNPLSCTAHRNRLGIIRCSA